jgi:Uma2 family endonuclease
MKNQTKIIEVDKPKKVTETEYWEKYYENSSEVIYEWNDGILEEKIASDQVTNSMYGWLFELMGRYLETHPVAQRTFLETGFRLPLPHKTTIRRPDLGIILNSNPVPFLPDDNSYRGICNLCIEALSDSTKECMAQDTEKKFLEYAAIGVQEYYMLYSKGEPMGFYYRNRHGVYVPIKPVDGDLIQSQVLPGFQFRISDLYKQPYPKEMAFDSVYKFVLPYYREVKERAEAESKLRQKAEQRAQQEAQRAEVEAQRAKEAQMIEEKKARQTTEDKIKRLEAELARLRNEHEITLSTTPTPP